MKKSLRMKKRFAWIGMMCATVLFFAAAIGSICFYEMDFYDYSEEEYRKMLYEEVADQYSICALENLAEEKAKELAEEQSVSGLVSNEEKAKERLLEQKFRYGIIKAETLDGLDLTDKSIYEDWNGDFPDVVNNSQLYVCNKTVKEGNIYHYTESLWNFRQTSEAALEVLVTEDSKRVEVLAVVYNMEDGIFYYETTVGYFPVQNLSIDVLLKLTGEEFICDLQYDFERQQYKKLSDISIIDTAMEPELLEEEILTQEYPSLLGLETMRIGGVIWQQIELDDMIIFNHPKDFNHINNASVYGELRPETDYRLSGEGSLVIDYVPRETTYCVVSVLPEEVGFGFSGDMFTQANTIVTIAYGLRYSIYLVLIGLFVLIIWNFGYLISKAGKVEGTEEIVITGLNKIPLEIHITIDLFVELVLCGVSRYALYEATYYPIPCILFAAALLLGAYMIAIRFLLDLAARIKKGAWWRNTLTYKGIRLIKEGLGLCVRQFSFLWKVIFGVTALTLLDLICTYGFRSRFYLYGKKIVFAAVIFWIAVQMDRLRKGGEKLAAGELHYQVNTSRMFWEFKKHGENLNSIRDGISHAVEERMKSEHFKTELITNVSHDIKTPLTSIINYVDLLEKEDLQNENAKEYLEVLERQSARLKKLIEDLIEASKASTGNLNLDLEELDAGVFLVQTVGEFEEKLQAKDLELRIAKPDQPVHILADSRHLWRVIDNLMNNICKYAQPQTRVYINIEETESKVMLIFRNTSHCALNIKSDELMERFVRGDSSRNTEGNGLGLSIAGSLMELMGGKFELQIDGDLFKVILTFANIKNI